MSDNLKKRLLQAHKAIKHQQYDKARKLLKGIDHPTAKKWLDQLDQIAPKKKSSRGLLVYGVLLLCILVCIAVVVSSDALNLETAANSISTPNIVSTQIPFITNTPIPLTDPLAIAIRESITDIERIASVTSLSIPGRSEVQYDFTFYLFDDANLQETLNAVSEVARIYREDATTSPAMISMNVFVVQGIRNENWRYSGTEWYLRAIDGSSVTATPYPTSLPYVAPPQNQSSAPQSSSYTCNCRKTCDQIRSCQEAYYQLNQCGCGERDGNNDGIPCNAMCG